MSGPQMLGYRAWLANPQRIVLDTVAVEVVPEGAIVDDSSNVLVDDADNVLVDDTGT